MSDKHWKQFERDAARLLGGQRYPANSGGRVDVESDRYVAQVKLVKTCSLASLEALAVEMAALGEERNKTGIVIVKRRAGRGTPTPPLVVMTEDAFSRLHPQTAASSEPTDGEPTGSQSTDSEQAGSD